ncbi:MAG: helix-turn-helix domain-containing protein [Clostridia bacterium]|nr:helix-turn-helix domain-containing protein [Clostridia bacterium]
MKQASVKRLRPPHEPKQFTSFEEIPDYLMVKDVADILRISVASAYHLVKAEGFPVLLLNGQMRVEKEAFISWMRGKERNNG